MKFDKILEKVMEYMLIYFTRILFLKALAKSLKVANSKHNENIWLAIFVSSIFWFD